MTTEAKTERKQKRAAAVCCVISGLILLAGLFCRAVLLPRLLELKEQTYQSLPYILYRFSVPPVTYFAAGLLLISLIALIANFRLPMPLRVVFLVLGTAFCLAPLLFSLEVAAMMTSGDLHQPIFTGLSYVMRSPEFLALFFRHLPFAAGILLFLGSAGSPAK